MTVTNKDTPPGDALRWDYIEITCAPRYDGFREEIEIPEAWEPAATKLVAVGRARYALSEARSQEGLQRLSDAWEEIREIWGHEARPLGMTVTAAATLLGLTRQALYNILDHKVGGKGVRSSGQVGPATSRSEAVRIREWARENGLEISDHGPIPRIVHEAYAESAGGPLPATKRQMLKDGKRRPPRSTVGLGPLEPVKWPRAAHEAHKRATEQTEG